MSTNPRNSRPLRFIRTPGGCFVCCSHKHNPDGYFRKGWADGHEMFHRFIYRARVGPIPEGWEVDHKCGNRACCNPDHLEATPRSDHLRLTNRFRYREREDRALAYWGTNGGTATALAAKFGVTVSSAARWIRRAR